MNKISIIVPVYNMEKYLSQCINSIISQTLKDIEIICIDDGSSDKSLEILKDYAKQDCRIILKTRKNKGVGYTRNEGLKLATGEFISFIDPDDFYPNTSVLEKLYISATNNNAYICGGSLIVFDEFKNIEIKQIDNFGAFKKNKFINYADFQYDYGFQRYIYNRKMIVNNNISFSNYKRFQDPPFMVNAMICAKKFYAIADYVYTYRWIPNKIEWTEDKIYDLLCGIYDNLVLAKQHNLSELFEKTLYRFKKDYKEIISKTNNEKIEHINNKIMDICIANAKKKFKSDLNPYVSVIIPIYNSDQYLKECLDSIINQTLQNIEIICVNDGSTDNSLDIVKEYASRDIRIKYIDKPNRGYGHAMNVGIDFSTGEYIGIVEPDDYIDNKMYKILYTKAKKTIQI